MMTIQELIKQKNKLGFTYQQIAVLSGLPVGTVQKVLGGITASPRYETLLALEKVLGPDPESGCLREDAPAFGCFTPQNANSISQTKKPGEFTIEDYYALPDDQRLELIDGVFYDMGAPITTHQIIALQMATQISNYIKANNGNCIPFVAPCDVMLDKDDKTMVQPDVMIICDRDKIIQKNIFGAPDFIAEIISPSTKRKDMSIKLTKYANAGVREYWMVDPDKLKILVYDLENDFDISIYGFEDKIPVGIYNGKLEIDFKTILEDISFLL